MCWTLEAGIPSRPNAEAATFSASAMVCDTGTLTRTEWARAGTAVDPRSIVGVWSAHTCPATSSKATAVRKRPAAENRASGLPGVFLTHSVYCMGPLVCKLY